MINYLTECMSIAVKGSIGMILWIIVISIFSLIFAGAIEFFKILFNRERLSSRPDTSEDITDADSQEEHLTIIDGGKNKDEL